jgi:alpha-glucosidase
MPSSRSYEVRLPGDWPPQSVTVNGKSIPYSADKSESAWSYEGNTLSTVIRIPSIPVTSTVTLHVRRSSDLVARRGELDGFAGAMTRLQETYDTLNQTWPLGWSPDELIDAMQSGDRLTYHPETASDELTHYGKVVAQATASVQAMTKGLTQEQMQVVAKRVGVDWKSDAANKKIGEYDARIARAAAEISDIKK